MTILADWQIIELAKAGMIEPFVNEQVKEVERTAAGLNWTQKVISYGVSSFGYDLRCSDEFKIFTPSTGQLTVVDPKAFDPAALVDYVGDVCVIPPHSYVLTRSLEYFKMPRNVTAICLGKSTYARAAVLVNMTPLESSWEGHLTIEISNLSPLPVKIYANEGIAQIVFLQGEQPAVSYADRKGKYQSQVGITLAKV